MAQREVIEVPVAVQPERSEWVGTLAELTRQITSHELPPGCLHPVYEALTVAINQLVQRDRSENYGRRHSFEAHPALPGRERALAAQIAATGSESDATQALWTAEIERACRRREARLRRMSTRA